MVMSGSPRLGRTDRSPEMAQRVRRSHERVRHRSEPACNCAIAAAVGRYLSELQAITTCETRLEAGILELRRQISVVEHEAAARTAGFRADQVGAAVIIRDQPGCTDIADLLNITTSQVLQRLALDRTQATKLLALPVGAERTNSTREQTQRKDRRADRHRRRATTDTAPRLSSAERAIEMTPGLRLTSAIGSVEAFKQPASNCRQHQPARKNAKGLRAGRIETCRSDCSKRRIGVSVERCDGRLAGEPLGCRRRGRPGRYAMGNASVTRAVATARPRRPMRAKCGPAAVVIESGSAQWALPTFCSVTGFRHG